MMANAFWGADIEKDPEEELLMIFQSGQLTFDTLKIAAGNFWEDETGQQTCGLWLYLQDAPDLDTHIRVHAGQTVQIADYHIRVHSLALHENNRWSVQLGIK